MPNAEQAITDYRRFLENTTPYQNYAKREFGRPISTITGKAIPTSEEKLQQMKDVGLVDFATAVTPIIGDIRDVTEVATNKPFLGQEPMSEGERLATYMGAALPFVPGAALRKLAGGDWLKRLQAQMELEQRALIPFRQPKTMIPKLTSTEQALEFGKKATPDQVARMEDMERNLRRLSEQQLKESLFDDAMQSATAAQFLREAREVAPRVD